MVYGQLPSCRTGFQKATANQSRRCDITLQSQQTQTDVTNSVKEIKRSANPDFL